MLDLCAHYIAPMHAVLQNPSKPLPLLSFIQESPQGGHHLDLTELPDSSAVSEARALSDLSTSASSVVSSKMARVAKQLESLKLSGGTTKSVMKTCEQHAGDPPLLDLPAVGATCNPQDTVALILARAKERRLSKENQKPEEVAPSSSDAPLDRKSVPAFVPRLTCDGKNEFVF